MDPVTVAVISVLDFLVTRAEAAGETLPDEVVQARTTLRRALVEESNNLGSDPDR